MSSWKRDGIFLLLACAGLLAFGPRATAQMCEPDQFVCANSDITYFVTCGGDCGGFTVTVPQGGEFGDTYSFSSSCILGCCLQPITTWSYGGFCEYASPERGTPLEQSARVQDIPIFVRGCDGSYSIMNLGAVS